MFLHEDSGSGVSLNSGSMRGATPLLVRAGSQVAWVQIDEAAQQLAEKQLADAANEPLPDHDDDELIE